MGKFARFEFSEVVVEEISADNSGRSFLIRISESKVLYYWCAEKSKEHGMELLTKVCLNIHCLYINCDMLKLLSLCSNKNKT